ncbi:hypothetical protein NDU88_004283 [Pleurodeles waltl]|uniref:Prolactin receptor n=1 Tax=Pleurodeles waltl TaxID=8319 RepID=A0AAV7L129_PLEWA|nr:hypothetical protein NDU88_004283 [Pleurodeles waltl]
MWPLSRIAQSTAEMPDIFSEADPLGTKEEQEYMMSKSLSSWPIKQVLNISTLIPEYSEEFSQKEKDTPSTSVGSGPPVKAMPCVRTVDIPTTTPKRLHAGAVHGTSGGRTLTPVLKLLLPSD